MSVCKTKHAVWSHSNTPSFFFFLDKPIRGIISGSSLLSLSYTVISPPLPTRTKVHSPVKIFQSCFTTDCEAPLPTHPTSILQPSTLTIGLRRETCWNTDIFLWSFFMYRDTWTHLCTTEGDHCRGGDTSYSLLDHFFFNLCILSFFFFLLILGAISSENWYMISTHHGAWELLTLNIHSCRLRRKKKAECAEVRGNRSEN